MYALFMTVAVVAVLCRSFPVQLAITAAAVYAVFVGAFGLPAILGFLLCTMPTVAGLFLHGMVNG